MVLNPGVKIFNRFAIEIVEARTLGAVTSNLPAMELAAVVIVRVRYFTGIAADEDWI